MQNNMDWMSWRAGSPGHRKEEDSEATPPVSLPST